MKDYVKHLVDRFVSETQKAKAAARNAKGLRSQLLVALKEEDLLREKAIVGNVHSIEIAERKVREWDKDALLRVYGDDIPSFVSQSMSIPASAYKALPESEKDKLKDCFVDLTDIKVNIIS